MKFIKKLEDIDILFTNKDSIKFSFSTLKESYIVESSKRPDGNYAFIIKRSDNKNISFDNSDVKKIYMIEKNKKEIKEKMKEIVLKLGLKEKGTFTKKGSFGEQTNSSFKEILTNEEKKRRLLNLFIKYPEMHRIFNIDMKQNSKINKDSLYARFFLERFMNIKWERLITKDRGVNGYLLKFNIIFQKDIINKLSQDLQTNRSLIDFANELKITVKLSKNNFVVKIPFYDENKIPDIKEKK